MFFIVNHGYDLSYRVRHLFYNYLEHLGYGHSGVATVCRHQTSHGAHGPDLLCGDYPCPVGCGGGCSSQGAPEAPLV
jgi:hypothetical protein